MYTGKRTAPPSRPRRWLLALAALAVALAAAAGLWALTQGPGTAQPPQPSPSPLLRPSALPEPTSTPDPTPTPEPTPTPDPAQALLAEMSLHEKVCQLFVVQPADLVPGVGRVTAAGEATQRALERYPVAGLLYDASNLVTMEQTKEMLANVQTYTKIPLILTCDEEGGRVNRLMHTIGTTYVGPMLNYKDQGPERAGKGVGSAFLSTGL